MIRINQLKLTPEEREDKLPYLIAKALKISENKIKKIDICKKSIDSRKKDSIKIIYSVNVTVDGEDKIIKKVHNNNIMLTTVKEYDFFPVGTQKIKNRIIIVGFGPAGIFCGLMLAKAGYTPLIIERGCDVDNRQAAVDKYWNEGVLDLNTNVQFGEGGAGTFSDGKLNTAVNDKFGRNRLVLETFVEFGAPAEILYENKPHIGTDILKTVVKNMREYIISNGGEVRFNTCLTNINTDQNNVSSVDVKNTLSDSNETIACDCVVLAIGHSARDTFSWLAESAIHMEPKSFAVGVRVMHPQDMINFSQYGEKYANKFGASPYKLTAKASDGRGVYSFCMCPGGYVVNASSENNMLAVNGMSYSDRNSGIANSAIIVTVNPDDYGDGNVLSGIEFQRDLERKAFNAGNGNIPIQTLEDFNGRIVSSSFGEFKPAIKGKYTFADINDVLPEYLCTAIKEGMTSFGHTIKGFDRNDTLIAAVESRTSSPVRIVRDEHFESSVCGIYPCGEGAGYAGGITSAAMDGIKVFEAIASKYAIK